MAEKRRQESFHARHPAVSGFLEAKPWEMVWREAAESERFWQTHLMELALLYERARGSTPNLFHQLLEAAPPGAEKKDLGKKPWAPKIKRKQPDRASEVCFTWSRNSTGCQEPCPFGRRHVCEGCGAAARGVECCRPHGPPPKKGKGKGGKGGKK